VLPGGRRLALGEVALPPEVQVRGEGLGEGALGGGGVAV
jgi:hypothetical protein